MLAALKRERHDGAKAVPREVPHKKLTLNLMSGSTSKSEMMQISTPQNAASVKLASESSPGLTNPRFV